MTIKPKLNISVEQGRVPIEKDKEGLDHLRQLLEETIQVEGWRVGQTFTQVHETEDTIDERSFEVRVTHLKENPE